MIARALIALLRGYKRYISPHLGHHCRFVPTCSEYAMQALATHGLVKGLLLTTWRLSGRPSSVWQRMRMWWLPPMCISRR